MLLYLLYVLYPSSLGLSMELPSSYCIQVKGYNKGFKLFLNAFWGGERERNITEHMIVLKSNLYLCSTPLTLTNLL